MKTSQHSIQALLPSVTFGVALILSGWNSTATAEIVANFEAGNTNTAVDGYTGMAGNGWTGGWALRNNYGSGSMGSVGVVDDGTLWDGNRLQLTPSNNATGTGFGVSREYTSYGDVNINQPITISFQVSFDDLGDFLETPSNFIYIGQQGTTSLNRVAGGTAWYLYAFGGDDPTLHPAGAGSSFNTARQMQWNVGAGDGSTLLPTDIYIEEDVLYTFTLSINPAEFTYTLLLSNGTETFESGTLNFFGGDQATGTTLVFGQRYAVEEGATFSVGNIAIIPEPSAFGMLLLGTSAMSFLCCRKRRTR